MKSTFNSKTSGYRIVCRVGWIGEKNNAVSVIVVFLFAVCCWCVFFSLHDKTIPKWEEECDDTGMRMHIALWDLITCSITLNRLVTPEIDQSVDHRIKKKKKKHDKEWNEMSFARASSQNYHTPYGWIVWLISNYSIGTCLSIWITLTFFFLFQPVSSSSSSC